MNDQPDTIKLRFEGVVEGNMEHVGAVMGRAHRTIDTLRKTLTPEQKQREQVIDMGDMEREVKKEGQR